MVNFVFIIAITIIAIGFVITLVGGSFVMTNVIRSFRSAEKHGGGVVGQVLAMKEQLEEQLTVECIYCGGKRARDGSSCPNCGATPPGT